MTPPKPSMLLISSSPAVCIASMVRKRSARLRAALAPMLRMPSPKISLSRLAALDASMAFSRLFAAFV